MKISSSTKIASIVSANPLALEAIVSISKSFEKLRNPYLYRLMAKRASIQMATKIAGCKLSDFYEKLKPLGFEMEMEPIEENENLELNSSFPEDANLKIIKLDVRSMLNNGEDPLHAILAKVNVLNNSQILELTNSFLPIPLISLLEKQGFVYQVVTNEDEIAVVRFYRKTESSSMLKEEVDYDSEDWDDIYARFQHTWKIIDVREMQMPMPMITILEAIDDLTHIDALFIRHHKVPLFLLPELVERNIEYRIHRLSDKEVNLILFKQ